MSQRVRLIRTLLMVLGVGVLANPAASAVTTALAAPTALTVTFRSGNAMLDWTDGSVDETGFSIERCVGPDCTSFGQIAVVGADNTSYADSFFATGINRYRVRALNSAGPSGYSNTAETVIISTADVSAVISATPTAGQAPLTVSFDGSGSNSLNGTVSDWAWSFGDNTTAFGAVVSHTYDAPGVYAASLKVTTTGAFSSTNSTGVIVTVTMPPLVAPSDLAATSPARGQGRTILTWTNPVSSATSLALERCRGAGCTAFARIAVLTPSTTTFTDVTAKRGITYTYRLAASSTTGTVYSNSAVVTVRR